MMMTEPGSPEGPPPNSAPDIEDQAALAGSTASREATDDPLSDLIQAVGNFTASLPSVGVFEGYEHVLPGSAERILSMTERQMSHRHEMERQQLALEYRLSNRGLLCAFILVVLVIAVSTAIILAGHTLAGTTVLSVDLVSLATVFIVRTKQRGK